MRAFIMGIVLALFSTAAWADNVLIVHDGYQDTAAKVEGRIINHDSDAVITTINVNSATESDVDFTSYDQVWDLRYTEMDTSTITKYDDFVKNGGFLYLVTENPGCCGPRNVQVGTLISNMGGGDNLTIGGSAGMTSNTITQVNATYMTELTNGQTIDLSAASAIENYGNGQWLIKDAAGKVAGVMWVGNAGNLATGYTGTVLTIADINWFDSDARFTDNNIQAVDDLLGGVVAGTVGGTITEEGNGDAGGGNTAPPAVTVTSTEAGPTLVVVRSADGGTVATIATVHGVSETDVEQTVETTVTTTLTTATDTTTCTTPTTVTNYSDGSSTTANGTESCATATTYASTSSATVDTVSGRIDQIATATDVVDINLRNLSFDGIQGIRSNHSYDNGMSGDTTGFTLGGEVFADNGLIFGGGWARMNTTLSGNGDTATATTNAFEGNVGRAMGSGVGTVTLRHATSDYGFSRTIGDWSNTGATSGSNSSVSGRFVIAQDPNFNPYVGYTVGRKNMDAYTEGGDALTARSVAGTNETYRYATVGANLQLGLINLHGEYNTDSVHSIGAGIGNTTERFDWNLGVEKTTTNLGENTGIKAGLTFKF